MWKQKIGISVYNSYYPIPSAEVVKMLSEIGFDAISLEWNKNTDLLDIVRTAGECGLVIQSLHAPYLKSADMWSKDERRSTAARAELLDVLEDCHRFAIPVMVVHAWIGFDYQFEATEQGFQNFGEIVNRAEKYGIKIAFENTEGEEYLFSLMEHFSDSDTVGFCWDSGHEMCYNHSEDLLGRFGDRLIMTHLNDNLGISRFDGKTFCTDDLHLLPFDGIADWNYNVRRLQQSRKQDILNFELNIVSVPNRHENDIYGEMDLRRYFTEAYKRACRIAYQYSRI